MVLRGGLMRLLLVDDDEILRCLIVNYLTREGHAVDQATDGLAALASINSNCYDAVICDWEMPGMDGPALCRAVRAGPQGHGLYFIMLTGRDSAVAQAEGYDSGIDAYLNKPCDLTELSASLRTAQSIADLPLRKAS
jgi:DNA-binding response OmpR family regulator